MSAMRRLLLALSVTASLVGSTMLTNAALAVPEPTVELQNRGACWYVVLNGKDVNRNGICYLGPPPPPPID